MLRPTFRLVLTLCLALIGVGRVAAQTGVRLSLGATKGSDLISDDLGGAITLAPAIAPTIALAVSHPVGHGYRMVVEGQFGSSTLQVNDAGTQDELGTLRTLGLALLLDGSIAGTLHWHAGGGALLYRPTIRQGVFLDDTPTRWLLIAGATWSRPLTTTIEMVATARYDFSTFTTRHLSTVGYSQFTSVQRGGLFLGLERKF